MKIIANRTMSLIDEGESVRIEANGKPHEVGKEAGEYAIRMGWAVELKNKSTKEKQNSDEPQ